MSTLLEAYRDRHPHHHQQIIPLDFDSARTVPDTHVWPQSENSGLQVQSDEKLSIPVIDFTDINVVKHIGRACGKWGAFQLTNHGIEESLLEDVAFEARRFFSLPVEKKMKALRLPGGATGYGIAPISPFFSKLMWHQGFTVIGSSAEHAKQLWPHDYHQFCDVMDMYQNKMKALADQLLVLILKSLNISKEEIQSSELQHIFKNSCTALQLNHYPSCPNPNRAVGLAPHTDTFLFTILHQGDINGLQIFKDGVGWVCISPVKGALVINMGDLFHILSNAGFPSVLHRVLVNKINNRLSVAYFYGPPIDFQIAPLPKLIGLGEYPHFRSLSVQEYISLRAKHLHKALSLLRIKDFQQVPF